MKPGETQNIWVNWKFQESMSCKFQTQIEYGNIFISRMKEYKHIFTLNMTYNSKK